MPAPYPIHELELPKDVRNLYRTGPFPERLSGLSRLNVLIGPNNSGKSRLLRALFSSNDLRIAPPTEFNQNIYRDATAARNAFGKAGVEAPAKLWTCFLKCTALLQSTAGEFNRDKDSQNLAGHMRNLCAGNAGFLEKCQDPSLKSTLLRLAESAERSNAQPTRPLENLFKMYIPTLRGLRRPPEGQKYYFRQRTFGDYFDGASHLSNVGGGDRISMEHAPVLTGHEVYDEVQRYLLGNLTQRMAVENFQRFLGKWFFAGKPVALIPRLGDTLHIKIGDQREEPVHRLGDGVHQIILISLPLFLHSSKTLLLFVEEPEMFLHPGYQQIWIDLVLNHSGPLQVFVATHSNHFMDITVDSRFVSIFKVSSELSGTDGPERDVQHTITATSNADFSVLRELGIRNSSVLLSNCTIWVEGLTDRLYIRHYLDLYQEKLDADARPAPVPFVENLHYCFVEYGGSCITHFSFLDSDTPIDVERLCSELFLVADRDETEGTNSAKAQRLEKIKAVLGDRCSVLNCVEIENLLSPAVIEGVIRSYEGPDVELNTFGQADYTAIRLGEFIEEKVLKDKSKSKRRSTKARPYRDDSGTVKDKVEFCRRAIEMAKSFDDLSAEARELTKAIYSFIDSHNRISS